MPAVYKGTLETEGVVQRATGRFGWGKNGANGVLTLEAKYDEWADKAPQIGSLHPFADWLEVAHVEAVQDEGRPGVITLNIYYEPVDEDNVAFPDKNNATLPEDELSAGATVRTVAIQLHPDFEDWLGQQQGEVVVANGVTVPDYEFWDAQRQEFKKGSDKYGIRHYQRPVFSVEQRTYYTERPGLSVLTTVGKSSQPPSPWAYASAENWLVTGGAVSREGVWWVRTLTYEYDEHGWDQDIYGA